MIREAARALAMFCAFTAAYLAACFAIGLTFDCCRAWQH